MAALSAIVRLREYAEANPNPDPNPNPNPSTPTQTPTPTPTLTRYAEAKREQSSRNGMQGLQAQLDEEIAAHRRLLQAMLADQAVEVT